MVKCFCRSYNKACGLEICVTMIDILNSIFKFYFKFSIMSFSNNYEYSSYFIYTVYDKLGFKHYEIERQFKGAEI